MTLENIIRRSAPFILASAGAILLIGSYRAFFRGESVSGATYALSSLIPIAILANSYRSYSRRSNSEETGVIEVPESVIRRIEKAKIGIYGVPNNAIEEIEKRDSGRHHKL